MSRATHPGRRIHQVARTLRRNLTPAEKKLWGCLLESQLEGFQFRRQFPIGDFIVDFCCRERRLIIEIDGVQHGDDAVVVARDQRRTELLKQRGYRVVRFWNEEVLTNLEGVVEQILVELRQPPPTPPPGQGEE
jgi:very-short-patch-repair endonuclease